MKLIVYTEISIKPFNFQVSNLRIYKLIINLTFKLVEFLLLLFDALTNYNYWPTFVRHSKGYLMA